MKNTDIDYNTILKAKNGDEEAIAEILVNFNKVIGIKSSNFFIFDVDKEDLKQECMVGILKAIKYYKPDREAKFSTFVNLCIQTQLASAAKRSYSYKFKDRSESLEVLDNIAESSSISKNAEDLCEIREEEESLQNYLIDSLSNSEKEVYSFLIKGLGYKEISEKLNKNPKSVDNTIQRIKKKVTYWTSKNS
jgi:RNA polymerase sporulation-specific sigma factor